MESFVGIVGRFFSTNIEWFVSGFFVSVLSAILPLISFFRNRHQENNNSYELIIKSKSQSRQLTIGNVNGINIVQSGTQKTMEKEVEIFLEKVNSANGT